MRKRSAIVFGIAMTSVLALASTAGAATIQVTNTHNSGTGSLRAAIDLANQDSNFDRIVIKATGTIPLKSGRSR